MVPELIFTVPCAFTAGPTGEGLPQPPPLFINSGKLEHPSHLHWSIWLTVTFLPWEEFRPMLSGNGTRFLDNTL